MKVLIYDIEIKKAIQGRNEPRLHGIEYCDGWRDHANMGISVIGAYETDTHRYRVFCDDNKEEFFAACDRADLLVTFNGIAFDDQVIRKTWSMIDFNPQNKSYDILVEMWEAAGLGPKFSGSTHTGFGLDATCAINFGCKKTGNGALAPVLWQQGRIGEVIDYCLNDVYLTNLCFDAIEQNQVLISPKGGLLRMRDPFGRYSSS